MGFGSEDLSDTDVSTILASLLLPPDATKCFKSVENPPVAWLEGSAALLWSIAKAVAARRKEMYFI